MKLNGKDVRLVQLRAEMLAAGITVPALGTSGDDLHTYDARGEPKELPASAQAVLDAHAPKIAPDPRLALIDSINFADPAQVKATLKKLLL